MSTSLKARQIVNPTGLLVACCAAGAAKAIEPPVWIFYPPGAERFDVRWLDPRVLASTSAVVMVIFVLAGGLMGDIYGRRRLLLIGLAGTAIANTSLLFAPSLGWHLAGRTLAIVAGALVLPLALAPIYSFFQGKEQGSAYSWYILTTTLAGLFAVRQGLLLTAVWSWRSAYLLPALISLVALVLVWKYVPEERVLDRDYMRAIGQAGWTLMVLAVVFGLFQATVASGWLILILGGTLLTLLIGAIAVMWWDVSTPGNLLRNTSIRTRDLTVLIITGVVIQLVLVAFYLPTHDLLQITNGPDASGTLLALLPIIAGMLTSMFVVTRYLQSRPVGRTVAAGFVGMAAAIGLMAVMPHSGAYILQASALFIFGVSVLATKVVWTNGFFQTVVGDYVGTSAAMRAATLQIGAAAGAVLGTQLLIGFGRAAMVDHLSTGPVQPGQARQVLRPLALVIAQRLPMNGDPLGDLLLDAYGAAFATGYSRTCLVLAATALLTALVIAIGVRRSLRFRRKAAVSSMLD